METTPTVAIVNRGTRRPRPHPREFRSGSVAEIEEDSSCPPRVFLGLRNGGARYDKSVGGVVFQSGRLFEKVRRWVIRQFRQQGPIVR